MTRFFVLLITAAGLLLPGCAGIPREPAPQDPLTGLFDSAPPAFPDLTAAVFISENTRNSVRYGMESAKMMPGMAGLAQSMLEQGIEKFKRNFKSTIRIESMAEAAGTRADFVVVMDMLIQTKGKYRITHGLIFMTPEGRTLDSFSAEAVRPFQMFDVMAPIQQADDEAQQKVFAAMRNSAPLAEYAASRRGASKSVAEAPPAAQARHHSSDVDKPGYRLDESPDDFALIIGIEGYQSLPPAEFAERDAAAIREHALALGYPERNIIYLTGPKAGRTGIEKYVETWLPLNVREDSRVLVYFSGHGAPDPRSGQAFLVPWDGDAKFLKNTGYPLRRLYESLDGLKAAQVVLAMDACFSGAGGRSVLAKGARPLVAQVDITAAGRGRLAVLAAADADEIAGSEDSQGHGLFTYHLLKGLSARKGEATLNDLHSYLLPRVQDAARRDGREQTPQFMPGGQGKAASIRLK